MTDNERLAAAAAEDITKCQKRLSEPTRKALAEAFADVIALHYSPAMAELVAAREELERLRAALPMTADGVAIVLGMRLFHLNHFGHIKEITVFSMSQESVKCRGGMYYLSNCYSTPEAAQADLASKGTTDSES